MNYPLVSLLQHLLSSKYKVERNSGLSIYEAVQLFGKVERRDAI